MKKVLIAAGLGIVVLGAIVGLVLVKGRSTGNTHVVPTPTPEIVELLPADTLSVSIKKGSYPLYILTIDKIPNGVTSLSYEITYDTTNKGTQGIVGSPITLKEGQHSYTNDKIVFGSESRGHYALDEGVNNIQINVRLGFKDGSEKGWKGTLAL